VVEAVDPDRLVGAPGGERPQGTVFGEVAELYDRARPGYPDSLVDDVLAYADAKDPRVLELGAGTGKATVTFATRGLEILALEPSAEMAAVARANCQRFPRVVVRVASFEDWQLSRRPFDLVISAQAWHWMDPTVRYAKAHTVLTAGGVLALFWNRPLWENAELRDQLDAAYERCAPELRARKPGFPGLTQPRVDDERADEIVASGLFGPVTRRSYTWSKRYSADHYVELLETQSDHRMLNATQRERLLGAVADIIQREGGSLQMDYRTQLYLARRADQTDPQGGR